MSKERTTQSSQPTGVDRGHILMEDLYRRLYEEGGVYEKLHDLAFSLGELSFGGKLATIEASMDEMPPRKVVLSAKFLGGITVSGSRTTASGNIVSQTYSLLVPSAPLRRLGRLEVPSPGALGIVGPELVPGVYRPGVVEFPAEELVATYVTGIDHVLAEVAEAVQMPDLQPAQFTPTVIG